MILLVALLVFPADAHLLVSPTRKKHKTRDILQTLDLNPIISNEQSISNKHTYLPYWGIWVMRGSGTQSSGLWSWSHWFDEWVHGQCQMNTTCTSQALLTIQASTFFIFPSIPSSCCNITSQPHFLVNRYIVFPSQCRKSSDCLFWFTYYRVDNLILVEISLSNVIFPSPEVEGKKERAPRTKKKRKKKHV